MAKTPMMRQWADIKSNYPDCIVLFRLGDFYEAFNEDAERVAGVCDVTLTSRPVRKGERVPMAGVPYHAVDGYIAQLVRAGLKVAIVEQSGSDSNPEKRARMSRRMPAPASGVRAAATASAQTAEADAPTSETSAASPAQTKPAGGGKRTILQREVVRVVTPGTLVEGDLIDARSNNFLVAVAPAGTDIGLCYLDVTTGDFLTTELSGETAIRLLVDELARLRPAEILLPEPHDDRDDSVDAAVRLQLDQLNLSAVVMTFAAWHFDSDTAARVLTNHFGVRSLAAYGCDDLPQAVAAAGAALAYVLETQQGAVAQIRSLATYQTGRYLAIDAATRRNLELVRTMRGERDGGTLLSVLDETKTAMGGRQLRRWLDQPLVDRDQIDARLDGVEALTVRGVLRAELRDKLKGVPDLERLTNRIVAGYAGPREVLALAGGLEIVPELRGLLLGDDPLPPVLELGLGQDLEVTAARIRDAVADEPPATLGVTGAIREGYSSELDEIHASVDGARSWIAGLEETERARTGIKKLKVGFNKVFGYYLSVPKSQVDLVPEQYRRKQTTVDGERYITPELKERETEVLHAEERMIVLERALFADLLTAVGDVAPAILQCGRDIAALDALCSLSEVAVTNGYRRPSLDDSRELSIRGGRHPVVERVLVADRFVPNDLTIGRGEIVLLTGPNMAGKSTVGRQAALIVLMAQMGSFVPADEACIGVVDRIFTRIGAQDEISAGQSTFMVEMVETAGILHHATERSLIVLDELGRGTSTYDGMAIAWAVVEHIHNHPRLGARTLFATHYHELTALSELLPRVRNAHLAVAETPDGIVFLHRVDPGSADRSYGVHVGELAGLPRDVTDRAWQILGRLEAEGNVPLQGVGDRPPPGQDGQLPLFTPSRAEHPVVQCLRELDPESMSPLEALTRLYELRRQVEDGDEGP